VEVVVSSEPVSLTSLLNRENTGRFVKYYAFRGKCSVNPIQPAAYRAFSLKPEQGISNMTSGKPSG